MRSKTSLLFLAVVFLAVGTTVNLRSKPASAPLPAAPPSQVFFGSAARQDSTTSTTFVNLVPTPGHVFTTTGQSTILVQFFSDARLTTVGKAMDIRAVVDGVPVSPGAMRYSGNGFSSISYSGFRKNVGPGSHNVTMQWMVTGGTGTMDNRTFIIWVIPE